MNIYITVLAAIHKVDEISKTVDIKTHIAITKTQWPDVLAWHRFVNTLLYAEHKRPLILFASIYTKKRKYYLEPDLSFKCVCANAKL